MGLSDWIRANMDQILAGWERDARQILPPGTFSLRERLDHARAMLERVANEMDTLHTAGEQALRATGGGQRPREKTGAQRHGIGRMVAGVDVLHVTTEFRALRLNVIKLWAEAEKFRGPGSIDDVIHFNQAIDQALAESIESFADEKRRQERLLDTMLSALPDPSFILDLRGRFMYANQATSKLYSAGLSRLIGASFCKLGLPDQSEWNHQIHRVAKEKVLAHVEMSLPDPQGDIRHYDCIFAPVLDVQGEVEAVVGSARDVTERRATEDRVWHHANHDLLTGLPNQRLFRDRLKQHARHAERTASAVAVFFIDLDHFKAVNDRLGHDAGDALLQQAATRIRSCVRESDTVARLGGDEFTLILLDIDEPDQINQIARDILAELGRTFELPGGDGNISASMGITLYPKDTRNTRQLLRNADEAMYAAKESGRNQFCYYTQVVEQGPTDHARLASELTGAAQRQEFELYYQPILELATDHIVKAEALLRWNHPTRGVLLAGAFIELVEETGLMGEVERWVLAQAVKVSREWNHLPGVQLQVLVNLSASHFCYRTLEAAWGSQLKQMDDNNGGLAVELTEKVFSHHGDRLEKNFRKLEQAHIEVALDDFGMGRSSMACLKKYPIGYLKIGHRFVQSYDTAVDSEAIVEATIAMAHQLKLRVIAEGVETRQQKEWLKGIGCDYAQGFFYSRPLPRQAFQTLLQQQ